MLTPTCTSSSTPILFIPIFTHHCLYNRHPQLKQFFLVKVDNAKVDTRTNKGSVLNEERCLSIKLQII